MGYLILFFWLMVLPICVGGLFVTKQNRISLGGQWLCGQFLLWSVFQIIAVFFIIREAQIDQVVIVYIIASLLIAIIGAINTCFAWTKVDNKTCKNITKWTTSHKIYAVIFLVLWLAQMVAILFLAVNDGDDAYYMAVANVAKSSGSMYTANVYSFGGTELTYRYALAPFPIWIAFLSRISGVHTLVLGHVILGMMLITMSYVIYAQIGKELLGENLKKRVQMLILVAILFIWGNTSSHTPESFLLLRSRQGKALVAGLVFPAMIYSLVKIGHLLEQKQKIKIQDYLLASSIILTGCLGSTLGGMLVILLWGSGLFFLAVGYKRWAVIPAGVLSTIPGLMFAVVYFLN